MITRTPAACCWEQLPPGTPFMCAAAGGLGRCVVIVKNVPARVCQQCGEASYSNEVAQQLEKIVEAVKHSIMSEVAIVEYSRDVA